MKFGRIPNADASDWRVQFRAAVTAYVLEHGEPAQWCQDRYSAGPNYYDWRDFSERTEHFKTCAPVADANVVIEDECFGQFAGTECGSEDVNLLIVHTVSCTCGRYTDVHYAVQASTSDILPALLGATD